MQHGIRFEIEGRNFNEVMQRANGVATKYFGNSMEADLDDDKNVISPAVPRRFTINTDCQAHLELTGYNHADKFNVTETTIWKGYVVAALDEDI
jgi:hypothetical protein